MIPSGAMIIPQESWYVHMTMLPHAACLTSGQGGQLAHPDFPAPVRRSTRLQKYARPCWMADVTALCRPLHLPGSATTCKPSRLSGHSPAAGMQSLSQYLLPFLSVWPCAVKSTEAPFCSHS